MTALPEPIVLALLRGEDVPVDEVEARVCARLAAVASAHLERTGKRQGDLVSAVAERLCITTVWARKLINGAKMPNVRDLHRLADFFQVEGGEVFFTAPPADALNRALLPILKKHEDPNADPIQSLLAKHGVVGVKGTDLRVHGPMTNSQLEELIVNVIRSVVPPQEGDGR
ncbi:hypothetical protein AB0G86_06510 [Streptomyces scabiei]|uniref:hypothetical protein n=1 Tax=Streptomyces scabiei TaxID=1930 RepID=UPI0033C54D9C